jgi:short-chain fatty acids transporter
MKKVVNFFTRLCEAYLPSAFVFCLILTLMVFASALVFTPHSPVALVGFWGKDFWSLNAFAMQMVFVLVTGHMLARTPLVTKALNFLTSRVHSETSAIVMLSFFSTLTCFLNWGFGLIVSGILAIELAKKLGKVNFGLFIATAYSGFLVWHGGLSGSIPLKIAGRDEVLSKITPDLSIPLSQTIFSGWNLGIVISLLVLLPLLALWMRTDKKMEVSAKPYIQAEAPRILTFRDKLENFKGFNFLFFIFFLIIIVQGLSQSESFDINRVNMVFLSLALLLHQTPMKFLAALEEAVVYASGVIIQFPFYAGLMGLMQHSSLADQIAGAFVQISTPQTLPLWTFLSGGIVNFIIPSGGGQWVVQGPIVLKAAQALNVDFAKVSMSLAWGDAWSNMIQPFWALPLLGLAKLELKDIMGYCLVFMAFSGVVISLFLL